MKAYAAKLDLITRKRDHYSSGLSLTMIHLESQDGQTGTLMATNGHALAVIPATLDHADTVGPISVEAWKAACKATKKGADVDLSVNSVITLKSGLQFPRPEPAGLVPKWDRIMPKGEPVFTVALNANLLANLATALGDNSHGVTLEFFDRTGMGAIRVTPCDPQTPAGTVGLLMPMARP